jgi:triacylglycerol lipase
MTDLSTALRALGRDFTMEQIAATTALYAPLVPRPTPDLCTVERDLAYGPDPRQRLDLFIPTKAAGPRPVVGFIHGGGFVRGEKGGPDAPFFNNFGAWAARQGFLGVTITYRLAPAHTWPAGSDDIAAAAAWLKGNVASRGGDPSRIVLVGQSAGATHLAGYLARRPAEAAATLRGAALLSGVYDVARAERNEFNVAYYGTDPARYTEQSTLEALARTNVPLLVTVSELEPPMFQRQAAWLAERYMAAHDRWPAFAWLRGHNHISSVHQIGTQEDTLGPLMASLVSQPETWT